MGVFSDYINCICKRKISGDFSLIGHEYSQREKNSGCFILVLLNINKYEKNYGCFFSRKSQYFQPREKLTPFILTRLNINNHEKKQRRRDLMAGSYKRFSHKMQSSRAPRSEPQAKQQRSTTSINITGSSSAARPTPHLILS